MKASEGGTWTLLDTCMPLLASPVAWALLQIAGFAHRRLSSGLALAMRAGTTVPSTGPDSSRCPIESVEQMNGWVNELFNRLASPFSFTSLFVFLNSLWLLKTPEYLLCAGTSLVAV